jgi:hypothetical protein
MMEFSDLMIKKNLSHPKEGEGGVNTKTKYPLTPNKLVIGFSIHGLYFLDDLP